MQYSKQIKKKKISFVALFIAIILLVTACSSVQETVSDISGSANVVGVTEDFHLRDKEPLYTQYDPTEIVTMYLTVSSGNEGENTDHTWEEINTYSVYDYDSMGVDRYKVEGLLQIGDENGISAGELGYNQNSPNYTVQIRGQTSSKHAQKNYKIKIKDNKGDWRGQTTIALNKHSYEGLRIRNKLVYDLIAGIDQIMGLRTTFVHLYVKDTTASGGGGFKDYGLYTQVEQLNKTALRAHGLDRNGHLYKINYFEFYRYADTVKLTTDPSYDAKAFEELLEIKGSDDHSKLIRMLDRVNDYSIPIDTILKENFDIENLSYWMGLQILLGNIDTQSRNFYIYSPLNTEKWYIIPWDNDAALRRTEYDLKGTSANGGWELGISNYWGNVLFQRCLKSENFRKELDDAIEDLRKYLTKDKVISLAKRYTKVVKPFVYKMPDQMYAPLSSSQYDFVTENLYNEIERNYNDYKESYKKPLPFYIGVPVKTAENKLTVEWDASFDFNSETISYSFEVARNFNFSNPIFKTEGCKLPTATFDMLPQGQYFIRVIATNESGYSQYAFDYYYTETGKIYGTKCFYVDKDGKIIEDVYTDG